MKTIRLRRSLTVALTVLCICNATDSRAGSDEHSPIHLTGQVMAGKIKHHVQPVYPKEAIAKGIEGTVKLHTIVASDGSVGQVEVMSGPKELTESAVSAVRQWHYQPTIWNGQAVEVDTTIEVVFKLGKKKNSP